MVKKRKAGGSESQANAAPDLYPATKQLSYKSELDWFGGAPATQDVLTEHQYLKVSPVTALQDNSTVLEFVFPSAYNWCTDLANTRLFLNLRLFNDTKPVGSYEQDSGSPISGWDPVTVSNNILCTLWSKVTVTINGILVNSHNANHHYRSFLEMSLNHSSDSKFALLKHLQGFITDLGPNPTSSSLSNNSGMVLRAQMTENGAVLCLAGKLAHDIFSLSRFFPPGTDIVVKLQRNTDNVCLLYDETSAPDSYKLQKPNYHIKIEKAYMEVLRFKLAPEAISYIEGRLAHEAATFYMDRAELRTFYIPGSVFSWQPSNIFGAGECPTRIIFGLIESSRYQGSLNSNSMAFRHYYLSRTQVLVDNVLKDTIEIENEWQGSGCSSAYLNLLKCLRVLNTNAPLDLTMDTFRDGPICVIGSDLSNDLTSASKTGQGVLSLNLTFSQPTPSSGLIGVIYGTFNSTLRIFGDKRVEVYDKIVL